MRQPVMMSKPLLGPIQERLEAEYEILRLNEPAGRQAIEARLGEIRAVVTGGSTGLPSPWFDKLPNLGLIAVNGVGTDKIDLDRAAGRGIHVTTAGDVLADEVADLAIGLVIATLRRMGEGERLVRGGGWAGGRSLPLGRSLKGKRLGIVGLGAIGRAVGRRAEAFSMETAFWNRTPRAVAGWRHYPEIVELARWADILVITVAATPQTRGLVDANVLEALGSEGFLINVARGSIVDEGALLDALENGRIAGAGLDVFLNEPAISERFLKLENVVLLPHTGSATRETRTAMGEAVFDSLEAYFRGDVPANSITAACFT